MHVALQVKMLAAVGFLKIEKVGIFELLDNNLIQGMYQTIIPLYSESQFLRFTYPYVDQSSVPK